MEQYYVWDFVRVAFWYDKTFSNISTTIDMLGDLWPNHMPILSRKQLPSHIPSIGVPLDAKEELSMG